MAMSRSEEEKPNPKAVAKFLVCRYKSYYHFARKSKKTPQTKNKQRRRHFFKQSGFWCNPEYLFEMLSRQATHQETGEEEEQEQDECVEDVEGGHISSGEEKGTFTESCHLLPSKGWAL